MCKTRVGLLRVPETVFTLCFYLCILESYFTFRYVLYRAIFFLVYGRTEKKMARMPLPNCLGRETK